MRLIIAGGRKYTFSQRDVDMLNELHSLYHVTEEICGEARGADTYGKLWAQSLGIPVVSFPADWDKYGSNAGPIRNGWMADYAASGKKDGIEGALVAFPGISGTADMVRQARQRGLRVWDWRGKVRYIERTM